MVTVRMHNSPTVALMSVACHFSNNADVNAATARLDVAGGSLIGYQITMLARAGIKRFLIEVENIDGALIALADRCRSKGHIVDFVRNGADIQRYLDANDRIWVQSGQLYIQLSLIETLLKATENFVATVDGRDENAGFERIDLNTRWAGVSIVGTETIALLKDLPEDWSIISSLLRQSVLAKIPFRPLPQQHVVNGTLNVLTGPVDFSDLNLKILQQRVASQPGFVEARVFGPIFTRVVPVLWQSSTAVTAINFASVVAGLGAVALGLGGFPTLACTFAFAAITGNSMRLAVSGEGQGGVDIRPFSAVTWTLIIMAMFGSAYSDVTYNNTGLFAAFAVASLAFLSQRTMMPAWAKQLLYSPAALAIIATVGTAVVGFTLALQCIMVLQLGILLIASVRGEADDKKAKQA